MEMILEIANGFISFLFSIIFFIQLYWDPLNPRNLENIEPLWLGYLEIILMIIMAADFLLFGFISDNRIQYLFSF